MAARTRERNKGGRTLKKLLFGTMLFALLVALSVPTMAQIVVNVDIPVPPAIVFNAPPDMIALPDTPDVYAVPGSDAEVFFYNGWWWRLWEGYWYRSRYYDGGWAYFDHVPRFYFDVDPNWRAYYRDHNWYGHRWNYALIPYQRLQQNWKGWHANHYWEKQGAWGIQGYQPRPPQQREALRQQRQQQYQQRPEVRQHQQQRPPQQVQRPGPQPEARVQQPQRQEGRPQVQPKQLPQPRPQPPQKRGGEEEEHRR